MQSIERYGVVALLFLVVTVIAVLVWDGDPTGAAEVSAAEGRTAVSAKRPAERTRLRTRPAAEAPGDTAPVATAPGMALEPDEVSRVELHLAPSARPLRRDLVAGSTPTDEETTREQAAGLRPADPTRRDASAPAIPWDDGAVEEPGVRSEPIRGQPRPRSPQGQRTYVVRGGDTLSEISQRQLGTSRRWREILAVNPGLDANRLLVGQELVLPGGAARASAPVRTPDPVPARSVEPVRARQTTATAGPTYRVRGGDSMWKIAQRTLGNGERWREIAALNPSLNPDHLIVGRELVLPAGASTRATPVVAASSGSVSQGSGSRARARVR